MTPSKTTLFVLLSGSAFFLACAGDAKSNPTWLEDVRPLVQANCVRCHAPPSIGGAPTDFRLDVYEDTLGEGGEVIRGARTMARYMEIRAGEEGSMPPDRALADVHRDTFVNWAQNGAALGARADNRSPRAELVSELALVDAEELTIVFDVSDAQDDLVWGELSIGDTVVSRSLRNGRNQVEVAPGVLSEGDHPLVALLSDDEDPVRRTLGTLRVRHQSGVAPLVTLQTPLRDRLIVENSLTLQVSISDPDPGQSHELDLVAFRGQEEVAVASAVPVTGPSTDIEWDTANLPEGPGWRLRVTATDSADLSTTIESGRFVISHETTNLGIEDVAGMLTRACAACHPRSGLEGLDFFLSFEGDDLHDDVDSRRGLIYRRVIQEGTMPPASAPGFAAAYDGDENYQFLSSEEKAILAEYLLGGSPR